MRKKFGIYLAIILTGVALVMLGVHMLTKEKDLEFHAVWTEVDRVQISEILNHLEGLQFPYYFEEQSPSNEYPFSDLIYKRNFSWESFKDCLADRDEIHEINSLKRLLKQEVSVLNEKLIKTVREVAKTGNPMFMEAEGWTLLHLACAFGKKELACHLMEMGASVNTMIEGEDEVFLGIFRQEEISPLFFLINRRFCEDFYGITSPALDTKLFLIEELARRGVKLDFVCELNGKNQELSYLWLNTYEGGFCEEEILIKLIEVGAKVEGVEKHTPLFIPINYGFVKLAQRMCEFGVNSNENCGMFLPFLSKDLIHKDAEVRKNSEKILEILLKNGLDINITWSTSDDINTEETLLGNLCSIMTVRWGEIDRDIWKEAITFLLKRGSDVNQKIGKEGHSFSLMPNRGGATPLILICRNQNRLMDTAINVEIARLLIKHGADMSLKDDEGKTAYDRLTNLKEEQIEKILESLPELKPE